MRKVIAIDFDGCLCDDAWPDIGTPHWDVIEAAKRERAKGTALILWTCRTGQRLIEAIDFCIAQGLFFDAINSNLRVRLGAYGEDSRKIDADEYWDDKAVRIKMPRVCSH